MRKLKVGDRFIHSHWPDSVCEIVAITPTDTSTYRYRSVAGEPLRSTREDETRGFSSAEEFVVKILTDEPSSPTLDVPETIYPPWPTASTERETQ